MTDYRKNEKSKVEIGKSESEEKTKISSPNIDRNDISEENKIKILKMKSISKKLLLIMHLKK